MGDGRKSIFLSTKGENNQEVSKSLIKFLHFVSADLSECESDFQDEFVERLQESVKHVKESREMEERFMIFQEMLKEEREEGRAVGREEGRTEEILRQIERKLARDKSTEQIAEELELTVGEAEEFVQMLQNR